MTGAHRHDDLRYCGAKTIVSGQSTVFVNGKLWSVDNDSCNHFIGNLKPIIGSSILINSKKVIVFGDTCYNSDGLGHAPTTDDPKDKSTNVNAY